MKTLLSDLRYGCRMLSRKPGFTAVAVLTLALGAGVTSAIFTIVNAYLFRPLPVKAASQLVVLATLDNHVDGPHEVSYPNFEDLRDRSGVFADAIGYRLDTVSLSTDKQAERMYIEWVTGNYFSMLGIQAALGRTFTIEEARIPASNPALVLSYGCWQRRFGGDPSLIGRLVRLNGHPFTVIGVAPEKYTGTDPVFAIDAFVSMGAEELLYPGSAARLKQRDEESLDVIGRLKPGVSLNQARAAVGVLARQLEQEYPATNRATTWLLAPETSSRPYIEAAKYVPRIAAVFMILVGLVLLVACANVANLMLARAAGRRKEMAVRAALGASRARLLRQLLTESLLLSVGGGSAGLLLGLWATHSLSSMKLIATDAPVRFDLSPDWRVFAFTLLIALLAGVISGSAPALYVMRFNVNDALKEGTRTAAGSPGRRRLSNVLVVIQIAISFCLLICAGLFIKSLKASQDVDPGFRKENLLLFTVNPQLQGYDQSRGTQFDRQLIDRIKTAPGVISATLSEALPLSFVNPGVTVLVEGRPPVTKEDERKVLANTVGLDYFRTMGIPLLAGRDFTEQDNEPAPRVAVINDMMARRFWPGEDPIRKRFRMERDGPLYTVIGVARDGKYLSLSEDPRPFLYLCLAQHYRSPIAVQVRTSDDPANLTGAVRRIVREMDQDMPVYNVKTMDSHLREGQALLTARLGAALATIFGLLGMALAIIGIYGVVSYTVTQRTHEIGVRRAVGAQNSDVLRLVVGQGLRLALVGVAIGMAAAFASARLVASLLFGVSPTDPTTFALTSLLLTMVALAASFIPARKAMKTDPLIALRHE